MSNILIIKHGSLGDIVQISGVLKDIRETHNDKRSRIKSKINEISGSNIKEIKQYVDY